MSQNVDLFFQVTIYEVSVINLPFLILQRTNVHVNLLSFCLKYKVHLRNTHRVLPIEQKFWFEILEIPHSRSTVHSGCTDLTRATVHLVIVLVSRIQKNGTGNNNFSNRKGQVDPANQNDWTGQSTPSSKLVLNIPVGLHQNGLFYFISNQSFWNFGLLDGKRP